MNLTSLVGEVKEIWGKVASMTSFTNPFGKQVSYRYPLEDVNKYQNVIKFTALARSAKSNMLDIRVPKLTAQALGSVTLYMPSSVTVNDNLSYDNVDTGIGGMLLNAAGSSANTSEFIDKLKGNSKALAQKGVTSAMTTLAQEKGMVGGAASQALINAGEVANPHTQMLFKSPALRQFSFQFKMVPRSLAEAKQIIEIVKFFRVAAYPELSNGISKDNGGGSIDMSTFKFPDIFQIKYITTKNGKENPNMTKIVDSYLTSVTVTYNPSAPVFFDNGMPSEIDLQLTFQESKALNRGMIAKDGY